MSIEIIGVGYSKNVKIGESFLQEHVINMWDGIPEGVFYYHSSGTRMTVLRMTKIAEDRHNYHSLLKSEITDDIKEALVKKNRTLL